MSFSAKKIGCGRYIQAPGASACLGEEVAALGGKKAMLIGGRKALESAGARLEASLRQAGIAYHIFTMTTDCTYETLDEIIDLISKLGTDIVIGCGGGKVMDMSKAAAKRTHQRLVTAPSSAATFNCWSTLSVMYYPDGKPLNLFWHETEVDCAIVDTEILNAAPARLLASGMVDAFAKYIEGDIWNEKNTIRSLPAPQYAAKLLAKAASDTLLLMGEKAYRDNSQHILSPEFDNCVFAVLADAAMAGALNYGHEADSQFAFAHNMYDMIRRLFTDEARPFMHGEIIGVALEAHMHVMGRSEYEINNFRRYKDVFGHPRTLRDMNIDPTDANLRRLLDEIMVWGQHGEHERQLIWEALHSVKG